MENNLKSFFDGAKNSLTEINSLSAQAAEAKTMRDSSEAELNSLQRTLKENIAGVYHKRRTEIEKKYDSQLAKANDKLRKAQGKRGKAKNQGIKDRITDETAALRTDIKNLRNEIRTSFKANGLPEMCDTGMFNSIYMPDSITDVLVIILAFVIFFAVIPIGIYKAFFDGSIAALIIIYIADVLIFGGIYISISRSTVMAHHDVLMHAKQLRRCIAADEKRIASISRAIQNDTNESYYDLAVYDDEIAHIKQELADITMQKNDALNTFENVTKNIITDEVTAKLKPQLDAAAKRYEEARTKYDGLDSQRKALAQTISENYEPYLGKEFMHRSKIEKLEEIIDHGTATNIAEAKEEYHRQYDI